MKIKDSRIAEVLPKVHYLSTNKYLLDTDLPDVHECVVIGEKSIEVALEELGIEEINYVESPTDKAYKEYSIKELAKAIAKSNCLRWKDKK